MKSSVKDKSLKIPDVAVLRRFRDVIFASTLSGFKDDFERLKSVVKGNEKNTVKCGILAIYDCYEGSSKSDNSLFDKHTSAIEQEFSKCKSTVQVDFNWKKIHVKEHDECYMAGAICVTSK